MNLLGSIDSGFLVEFRGLFRIALVAIIIALLIAPPLYFLRQGVHAFWDRFDEGPRKVRWQVSIRTLLAVMTYVALVLGVISAWTRHVASLHIARYATPSSQICDVGTVCKVKFSRRGNRTTIDVVPGDGLGQMIKAEFIWLEGHELHRAELGDAGRIRAGRVASTTEWPLVFGVVQYHPEFLRLCGQQISMGGHRGQCLQVYEHRTAQNPPVWNGEIEAIAHRFLWNLRH